ncbi:MAG: phosphatidylserine decarboxylase family protein [Desulfocapsaceae bacterium]|nr:phosphatidylserine decarboxylase family protein [Desulfocapsaceae bacterium]
MITPRIPIAKEGYPFLGSSVLITLVLAILGYKFFTLIALLVSFFILYFFRDPERFMPRIQNAIVCPADGKVIIAEKVFDDRFFHEYVHKISIFMNIFNVHVNRIPQSGIVEKIIYTPGEFYSADSSRGGLRNENCATIITGEEGRKIAVVQIAGLIARRIVCWLEPEDTVRQGDRFGLIRFGSRVDLYIPGSVQLSIKKGETVRAGETILGTFIL